MIATVVFLCIVCWLIELLIVSPIRNQVFNATFMEQFEVSHSPEIEGRPSESGCPDSGEGRFAAALDYRSWVLLNRANRYHSEFVQRLPFMVTVLLVSGLYLPYIAMSVGVWNAVVRLMSLFTFKMNG